MAESKTFPTSVPTELLDKCRAYAQEAYQNWARRNVSYVLVDDDNLDRRDRMPDYDDLFEWAQSEYTGQRRATHISGQGWRFPTCEDDIVEFCADQVREYVVTESGVEEFDDLLDEHFGDIEGLVDQCYVDAIGSIQQSK